jgi:dienelactone hydrolase
MRHLAIRAGVVAVGCILAVPAGGQELLKVTDGKTPPADSRLGKARDYNTTTDWNPDFADKGAWERRAGEVRQQILVAEGLYPMPERTPLNPVFVGKIDRDDYTIERVYLASLPGHYVVGNLYRPKNAKGKMPVVLYAHGHWNDGRLHEPSDAEAKKSLASGAEKTPEGAKYFLQAPCAQLARMGCVVFAYNMVGYGDSKPIEHRKGFNDVEAELRLQSFMGLQTWNSIRVLDFMLGLEGVDPERVAITGASGGGTQSMILAGIDPRVSLSFPAVMVSMNMQGGCICENASLLRVGLNNVEFAATFAPKPQGMTAADDWTKDVETKGLPQLRKIYGLYGAEESVGAWYRPFPHNYNQVSRELMYNWVNKHFKLGLPEPVTEKPFVPVPPKELAVWDEQHPLPNDAADAQGLRQYMTAASDKQLDHLIGSDPQEYRRILTTALRVMINDKWPVQAQVLDGSKKERKLGSVALETGLLTRPGEGSAMPYALLTPGDWNGETVIWEHPAGKLTLLDDNEKPIAPVQRILDNKFSVLCGDLFLTGEYVPEGHGKDANRPVNKDFAGYTFGYNRSVLAERVHDILTLVAFAKSKESKFVHQVAWEGAGLWGLLAKGAAGEAILRSAIDLNGFDFDSIKDVNDENFLPGAIKYGGVMSFVSLCRVGETALYRKPEGKDPPLPARGVRDGRGRMVDWVIRTGGIEYEEVPRR